MNLSKPRVIPLTGGLSAEIRNYGRLGFHTFILRGETVVTDAWHAKEDWAESWARGHEAHGGAE